MHGQTCFLIRPNLTSICSISEKAFSASFSRSAASFSRTTCCRASCMVRLVGKLWFSDNFPPSFAFFESLFSASKALKRMKIPLCTPEIASQKRQIMLLVTLFWPVGTVIAGAGFLMTPPYRQGEIETNLQSRHTPLRMIDNPCRMATRETLRGDWLYRMTLPNLATDALHIPAVTLTDSLWTYQVIGNNSGSYERVE